MLREESFTKQHIHTIWFHARKAQEQAKLIYGGEKSKPVVASGGLVRRKDLL